VSPFASLTDTSRAPSLVASAASTGSGALDGAASGLDGENGATWSIRDSRVHSGANAALSMTRRSNSAWRSTGAGCAGGTAAAVTWGAAGVTDPSRSPPGRWAIQPTAATSAKPTPSTPSLRFTLAGVAGGRICTKVGGRGDPSEPESAISHYLES